MATACIPGWTSCVVSKIKYSFSLLCTIYRLACNCTCTIIYLLYNSTENASKRMKLSDIFNGNANGRNGNIQRALTRRNANNATIKFKYNQKKTIKVSAFVISPFTGEFGSLNWGLVQFLSCFASLLPRFFAFRALLRLLLFSCLFPAATPCSTGIPRTHHCYLGLISIR